mgnify:CR=1 FL=1
MRPLSHPPPVGATHRRPVPTVQLNKYPHINSKTIKKPLSHLFRLSHNAYLYVIAPPRNKCPPKQIIICPIRLICKICS